MEQIRDFVAWIGTLGWRADVGFIITATAAVDFLQRRLLRRLAARLEATATLWDDAVIDALRAPIGLALWIAALTTSVEIADQGLSRGFTRFVPGVRDLGVVIAVTWFLLRWIRNMHEVLLQTPQLGTRQLDKVTIDAMRRLSTLVVVSLATVTGLETMGFDLSAVLTVGGIGGVAIGFASRDVIANFFGGLMIFMTQPFKEGDWIRSPDREIEGTVEEIGWYQTTIRTFASRPLYVPNSTFPGISVENPSRMRHRRIYETIGVRYDDFAQIERIVQSVRDMLRTHPEIASEGQTLMVNFDRFAASSLDFFVYCFTKTRDWATYHEVKQDVLRRIGEIVAAHGAEIAFPTRTIHVPSEMRATLAKS